MQKCIRSVTFVTDYVVLGHSCKRFKSRNGEILKRTREISSRCCEIVAQFPRSKSWIKLRLIFNAELNSIIYFLSCYNFAEKYAS